MSAEPPNDLIGCLSGSAGIGILAADERLVITYCNATAADLLGTPTSDLLGREVLTIVPPERKELAQRLFDRILEGFETADFEFRYRRADGRWVNLAVTISAIRQAEGIIGVSVFLRDITRHLVLLRDIAQAQKMAALESMAGAIAHHFNNILGGAITTADFALASDDADLHKRTLGITIAALSRANELTQGLLSFAEGEHAETVKVDIRQTLERYVAAIEPTLLEHSIRLAVDLQPVRLDLPPRALNQVLDRLFTNVIEALPNGGTLGLELLAETTQAVLRVSDSGPGISEQDLPRIFEPFFSTKPQDRGRPAAHTGLGLAVVHGIVKDLGGSITVSSSPGAGTTFTIRFPNP